MPKSLNRWDGIGNLGQDPEVTYMPSGQAVSKISIACSDDYKDKNTGQKVSKTHWVPVIAFGRLAEIIGEYCRKGSKVYISGKFTTSEWVDGNQNKRSRSEIVANEMQLLDSPQGGQKQGQPQQNKQRAPQTQKSSHAPPPDDFDMEDDLPF